MKRTKQTWLFTSVAMLPLLIPTACIVDGFGPGLLLDRSFLDYGFGGTTSGYYVDDGGYYYDDYYYDDNYYDDGYYYDEYDSYDFYFDPFGF